MLGAAWVFLQDPENRPEIGDEWVFDMITPDGTVFPNYHLCIDVRPEKKIGYTLLWGENGPKHADAWARFEDWDGAAKVTRRGVQHRS